MQFGIDYVDVANGTGKRYSYQDITDAILDSDFTLFKVSGFTTITLNPEWAALESSRGTLNSATILGIKRVLAKAVAYDLKVVFCFHTHYETKNPSGSVSAPSYVSSVASGLPTGHCLNVIYDTALQTDFINMVNNVIAQIDVPIIEAYSLQNEPHYQQEDSWVPPLTPTESRTRFEAFFAKLATDVVTSKPKGIKYPSYCPASNGTSGYYFRMAQAIAIWDYIGWTNYWYPLSPTSYGQMYQGLRDSIASGKPVWMLEFGSCNPAYDSACTHPQAAQMVNIANQCVSMGIHRAYAWMWGYDYSGGNFTINDLGTPRQSYKDIAALITPTPSKKYVFSHWQDGDINPQKTVTL